MTKFVAVFSTACLITLFLYLFITRSHTLHPSLDSGALVKEVRPLNELVTVHYSIEKIVGMKEQKQPLGEESILLMVRGKVLAGIDLSELKPSDVTFSSGNVVHIRLTPPRVEDTYLDEKFTKVWDRSITWWTPWVTPNPDLEHKARLQALTEIRSEAIQMGILPEAKRIAELDIRQILDAFGITKVAFDYST
jgi:hypothetical protein